MNHKWSKQPEMRLVGFPLIGQHTLRHLWMWSSVALINVDKLNKNFSMKSQNKQTKKSNNVNSAMAIQPGARSCKLALKHCRLLRRYTCASCLIGISSAADWPPCGRMGESLRASWLAKCKASFCVIDCSSERVRARERAHVNVRGKKKKITGRTKLAHLLMPRLPIVCRPYKSINSGFFSPFTSCLTAAITTTFHWTCNIHCFTC